MERHAVPPSGVGKIQAVAIKNPKSLGAVLHVPDDVRASLEPAVEDCDVSVSRCNLDLKPKARRTRGEGAGVNTHQQGQSRREDR